MTATQTIAIKTVYTEEHLRRALDTSEKTVERIIRLNPQLTDRELEESLRRNCKISPKTISYNLSHQIGVLWSFQGVIDRAELANILRRIDNLVRFFPLLPWAIQKKKGLDRIVRGRR